jgi:hypothetical protein
MDRKKERVGFKIQNLLAIKHVMLMMQLLSDVLICQIAPMLTTDVTKGHVDSILCTAREQEGEGL